MKLLTAEITRKLSINGRLVRQGHYRSEELAPVVKLFIPDANATWLLSELDPDDHDIAFGLCDLGLGEPELGEVSIAEIQNVRGVLGLPGGDPVTVLAGELF